MVTAMTLTAWGAAWAGEEPKAPPLTPTPVERSKPERAWDDLRWLMTALEAYAIDNDSAYAEAAGPREGAVADLERQLEWYYGNTYPKRSGPPYVDPWGRPYRFLFSRSGRQYALYSLGEGGTLGVGEEEYLKRVRGGQVAEGAGEGPQVSRSVVVAMGALRFAPAEAVKSHPNFPLSSHRKFPPPGVM